MSVETARVEGRKTLAYKSQQGVEKEEEKKDSCKEGPMTEGGKCPVN